MNGRLFRSMRTLPASAGLVLQVPDLPHFNRALAPEQRRARATLKEKGFQLFLEGWSRLSCAWKVVQTPPHRHNRDEEKPRSQQNTRTMALSAALNTDKGARARAVHLVVVEQTLVQEISGGLNAVPVDVLRRAIPQLASLSRFRSCIELKLLLQSMHQIVETHAQLSKAHKEGEFNERPGFSVVRSQPEELGDESRIEPSRRPTWEPAESVVADDDFPDTEAFSEHEADIPLPMPLLGRAVVVGKSGK